jgi:hypothetical protein
VTTASTDDGQEEFLAVAGQALRTSDGSAALDALGWWDLLSDLGDHDGRAAVFAVFRAQGRELASSPALGGLVAQPFLAAAGRVGADAAGTVVATIPRRSPRRGCVNVAVGDVTGRQVLIDRPGSGASIVDAGELQLRPIDVPGRLPLREVGVDVSRLPVSIGEHDAARARPRSVVLGRVAAALEVLGAAEGVVALAVEHARAREQFGQPIAGFQAVRHLLAWARTDCAALESVTMQAVALDTAAPPRFDEIVKAIAGRNGRRACERALQVFGGIGFTAEHSHHHFHSRVLALDSLLGTSAELTHGLGTWLRAGGSDPQIPSGVLYGEPGTGDPSGGAL